MAVSDFAGAGRIDHETAGIDNGAVAVRHGLLPWAGTGVVKGQGWYGVSFCCAGVRCSWTSSAVARRAARRSTARGVSTEPPRSRKRAGPVRNLDLRLSGEIESGIYDARGARFAAQGAPTGYDDRIQLVKLLRGAAPDFMVRMHAWSAPGISFRTVQ